MTSLQEAQTTLKDLQADLRSLETSLQRAEEALTRARRERQEVAKLTQLATRRDTLAGLVRDQRCIVEEAEAEVEALEREKQAADAQREAERRLKKHDGLLDTYRAAVANLLGIVRLELAKVLELRAEADENARRLRGLGHSVAVPSLSAALEHPVSGERPLLEALEDFSESQGFEVTEDERQRRVAEYEANRKRDAERAAEFKAACAAAASGETQSMVDYYARWGRGEVRFYEPELLPRRR